MTTHKDTGARCLHVHYEGYGCECGAEVRPHEWREHIGAAAEALAAKRDAEAAVIAAAKAWNEVEALAYHMKEKQNAEGALVRAVDALRALEGDA
jgi:hypothetical protein